METFDQVQILTLFVDFTKVGFALGLGIWLISYALAAAWRMFKKSIGN